MLNKIQKDSKLQQSNICFFLEACSAAHAILILLALVQGFDWMVDGSMIQIESFEPGQVNEDIIGRYSKIF